MLEKQCSVAFGAVVTRQGLGACLSRIKQPMTDVDSLPLSSTPSRPLPRPLLVTATTTITHAHRVLGRLFAVRLRQIGQGTWGRDGTSKRLSTSEPGLELWRTKVTRGGRIIWQVGGVGQGGRDSASAGREGSRGCSCSCSQVL